MGRTRAALFQKAEKASWPVRRVMDINGRNYGQCPEERIKLSVEEGSKMCILSFNKNNCVFPPRDQASQVALVVFQYLWPKPNFHNQVEN